jgi:hypothetical protein
MTANLELAAVLVAGAYVAGAVTAARVVALVRRGK